jgi:hypothetical protein
LIDRFKWRFGHHLAQLLSLSTNKTESVSETGHALSDFLAPRAVARGSINKLNEGAARATARGADSYNGVLKDDVINWPHIICWLNQYLV